MTSTPAAELEHVDGKPLSPELEFFRTLNRIVEPRIRAGWGSPRLVPGGLVVTRGGRLVPRNQVSRLSPVSGVYMMPTCCPAETCEVSAVGCGSVAG